MNIVANILKLLSTRAVGCESMRPYSKGRKKHYINYKQKVEYRVFNIGCRSIADSVSPTLFQYRSRYRQYFPAQVSHAVSAILFWSKIRYLFDTFLLKIIFLRLDSFFHLDIRDVSENQDFGVLVYILR